jgi:hypothetical protein
MEEIRHLSVLVILTLFESNTVDLYSCLGEESVQYIGALFIGICVL